MNRDQYLQKMGGGFPSRVPPTRPEKPASQAMQGDPVPRGAVASTDGDSLPQLQQQAVPRGAAGP